MRKRVSFLNPHMTDFARARFWITRTLVHSTCYACYNPNKFENRVFALKMDKMISVCIIINRFLFFSKKFTIHANLDKFENKVLPWPKINGHTMIEKGLWQISHIPFDASVFEQLHFWPSTLYMPPSQHFYISPLWRPFSKGSVFGDQKHYFSVNGRPNWRKKMCFQIYLN